jgi:hypothetical protein
MRLQLVDQSFQFPEGIAKDIMVNIRDHYVPTDFMILDIGDEDDVHLILGRPFLNTTSMTIYMKSGYIHFQFPAKKVCCYFNSYTSYEQPRKIGRGDIVLSAKRSKSLRTDGQTIQGKCPDMKTIGMMNLRKMKVPLRKLHHQQTHRSSQYAKRKNLRK